MRPQRGRLLWAGLLGAALVAGLLPLAGQLQPAPRSVAYTVGRVASSDGTMISYRILGHGPGLVLVHGGMMAAQNFMKLGKPCQTSSPCISRTGADADSVARPG